MPLRLRVLLAWTFIVLALLSAPRLNAGWSRVKSWRYRLVTGLEPVDRAMDALLHRRRLG